jgi:PASTA domain-containing protein/List-Bact-rpt repeat protein
VRFGSGRPIVVSAVAAGALVVFGAASAAAQPAPRQTTAIASSSSWGNGVEAVLPANAAPTGQNASVRVVCPSAGNCSAVGTYVDTSGNRQMVLLTETAGAWSPGVQAVLPANAATTQNVFEIDAMSCPSAGNCSAVGTYTDTSGSWQGLLLSETDGTWWPAIEAPLPANAWSHQMVALLDISCASAGNCTAVGAYYANDAGGLNGLLLTETAGTWATGVEATLPAHAVRLDPPVGLTSVSCASAGNCSAVGSYMDSSGNSEGLLLTETAGSWGPGLEVQPPGTASAPANAYLYDVSCPSTGNCSAIGSYTDGSGNQEGLLVTETAGTWSPGMEAILPTNAATTQQRVSVSPPSCASAGECGTVGSYVDSSGNSEGLLLSETGGAWSPGTEAVLPANAATTNQQVVINPPSCPSAGECSAVGSYIDSSGNSEGLLLTETGGTWSTGSEPVLPANAATTTSSGGVTRLSCPSAGNCGAVGSYTDSSGNSEGLLLTETGGTWSPGVELVLPPNAAMVSDAGISSLSCPSAGECGGGGSYADDSSGGGDAVLLLGGSAPTVKVDVLKTGPGAGTVSSAPAGIDCGSTCSASFDAGTSLTLTAIPSPGSRFKGWSGGGCRGNGSCQVNTGISEQTVAATFSLLAKQCVVPRLKGKTLRAAKRAIRIRSCTVGKVKHAASRKMRKGRVISQKPRAGRRLKHAAKINLVLSTGRRR